MTKNRGKDLNHTLDTKKLKFKKQNPFLMNLRLWIRLLKKIKYHLCELTIWEYVVTLAEVCALRAFYSYNSD